jgi:hypothetical protein
LGAPKKTGLREALQLWEPHHPALKELAVSMAALEDEALGELRGYLSEFLT